MTESTLQLAQAGDSGAFDRLVAPHRRELHVHCYRILGSTQDAEDVLQDVLVAAWQAIGAFDGRALRAWLYRIATNRCRNQLRDRSRRPEVVTVPEQRSESGVSLNPNDPWWLEPYPDLSVTDVRVGPEARYDARESVALSFVAGLQRLPIRQRTALVLRDVLGFSAAETADMLECSIPAVNSALVRARTALPPRDPGSVPLPTGAAATRIISRFVDAFQAGDVDAVVALLSRDAVLTMPPEPLEVHGPDAIAAFYRSRDLFAEPMLLVPTTANCQTAFGYYRHDPHTGLHRAAGLLVLELAGPAITGMTRFGEPALLARFGLPRSLAPTDG